MNKNKKGFTIVELVVVIAIIAILAAILIPTFGSIIRTAQTSADVHLVKNLNIALSASEARHGRNNTMYDALADAFDAGYDIRKLTPTNADNEILWDQTCDRFVLYVNEKYDVCGRYVDKAIPTGDDTYKLWKIYTDSNISEHSDAGANDKENYSIYWNGTAANAPETVSVGFDSGDVAVAAVEYKNEGTAKTDAIIRTNGGTLTIDAENDTVKHYGDAKQVDVDAVAMSSYHEFGKVLGNINLKQGNVVVEKGCSASAVVIDKTAAELATVTTISADNSQEPSVPIILNTTEYAWEVNENNSLIDPIKNNIIYTKSNPENFDNLSEAEKINPDSMGDYGGVIKKANGNYVYFTNFIGLCTHNSGLNFLKIGTDNQPKAGDTIVLFKDVDLTAYNYLQIYLNDYSDELSINLNGHTLTLGGTSTTGKNKGIEVWKSNINIYNGRINGNTNIIYTSANGFYHINNVVMNSTGSHTTSSSGVIHCSTFGCIIENSVITATGTMDIVFSSNNLCIKDSTIDATNSEANVVISKKNSNATLDNVDIKGNETAGKYMFYSDQSSSTLTINGGNFTKYTHGKSSEGITATISITGGTFDADPSENVDTTQYVVKNNGDGTWTVSAD